MPNGGGDRGKVGARWFPSDAIAEGGVDSANGVFLPLATNANGRHGLIFICSVTRKSPTGPAGLFVIRQGPASQAIVRPRRLPESVPS